MMAVDLSRFFDFYGYVLKCAVKEHHEEGHPQPDIGDKDRRQPQVRVVQPVNGVVSEADVHEKLVDRPAFQLEQELEDDTGHYQGQ
jgi:hypothetical protein